MKLLSITNRYFFLSLLLLFSLAGVVLFYAIRFYMNEEMDEQLNAERSQFEKNIQSIDSLDASSLVFLGNIDVEEVSSEKNIEPEVFDSMMYSELEKEMIPFRLIRFSARTKKADYTVLIKESKLETVDIVNSIFCSLMLVFGLFCVVLYLSNCYLNKRVWSPVLKTIQAIKKFNINDREASLKIESAHIEELNELNAALQKMIERIKSDFFQMKEFSENAAHELQTPLSIIRSKLETLLQSENLKDEDARLISQALEGSGRLSRLNQSLLLLTKIENRQYEQKQMVRFSAVFEKYLEIYTDVIAEKRIAIQMEDKDDFVFEINLTLADMLISNLLGNSIKHNNRNGNVRITLFKDGFEISNSGDAPLYPTEQLSNRFKKGNNASEHLGLGLALVKEIVETSGLQISYTFEDERHVMAVKKRRI